MQSGTFCCEFGYGGTDRSAALRLQHSIRPHRMGCGASGLRAQDAHRTSRGFLHQPQIQRHTSFSHSRRKRLRHLYLRTCLQFYFGGFGYGCRSSQERRKRPPRSSRHWRRQHERRTGFRGLEQCFVHGQQPVDYPQR